ncbi:MAG TPA: phosphate acyltransferase PlsX [Candidatus Limnocylindria bacterium]|nr:phosphate acyltransferase PlsX [Candidatus Limnocylindria bacterium]
MPTIALDVPSIPNLEMVRAAARISVSTSIECLLVGDEGRIQAVLDELEYNPEQIGVLPGGLGTETALTIGLRAVARGDADAMVSAGNAHEYVTACSHTLGLLPGVRRPALAAVYPRQTEYPGQDRLALLLDAGATPRCGAPELVQYALMGAAYARRISKIAAPRIGLLAMGRDMVRHDEILASANAALAAHPALTYVGEVEGHELVRGRVDVIVCEGMVGGVVAGLMEGFTGALVDVARAPGEQRLVWRVGMRLFAEGLERVQALTDFGRYGGAPILGFDHVVIKCQARADVTALGNAIKLAAKAVRDGVPAAIAAALGGPAAP